LYALYKKGGHEYKSKNWLDQHPSCQSIRKTVTKSQQKNAADEIAAFSS